MARSDYKFVLWVLAAGATLVVIAGALVSAWFFFYTGDLPSMSQLQDLTPDHSLKVTLGVCDEPAQTVYAVPYEEFGPFLVPAVLASEPRPVQYSMRIARDLACFRKGKHFSWAIQQLRLASQIERTFDSRQMLAIYLNRVYLGEGTYGVEAASSHYFGKTTSKLSLAEAAMIAGLIRGPEGYSPARHPDRALQRRNAVLDSMVQQGAISQAEADRAKGGR